MPTPSGLPKKGERVRYQQVIFDDKGPVRYGTVVARGTGDYWTLYVRWDDGKAHHPSIQYGRDVDMLVDAAYALKVGWLRIVPGKES